MTRPSKKMRVSVFRKEIEFNSVPRTNSNKTLAFRKAEDKRKNSKSEIKNRTAQKNIWSTVNLGKITRATQLKNIYYRWIKSR